MKKTIVTMAAMLLMAGAAFAQAPEQEAPAKQETAAPAEEPAAEQASEPAKEEKAETDGENKGDCTKEKCQGADSSSTDAEAKPAE